MYPTRPEAEALLRKAASCSPGAWSEHSQWAATCAERIAASAGMNAEKAYVLGLLHDVGRKFGVCALRHIYDGWKYMQKLGYDDVARICLTHSFNLPDIHLYIGSYDIPPEAVKELQTALDAAEYDDYDRLIQLCDALAMSTGIVKIEDRMADVCRRYGGYPPEKWQKNLELKGYFEAKCGADLYDVLGHPELK